MSKGMSEYVPVGAPSQVANNLDEKFFINLVSITPFLLKSFDAKEEKRWTFVIFCKFTG